MAEDRTYATGKRKCAIARVWIKPGTGEFIAELGVGVVHAEHPDHRLPLSAAVLDLHARVKRAFDPTGRLNPGRKAEAR